ncbi:MAG: DMT family transporter [Planctomycetia bacterium]|nr:DMT family transporter [Planctomycetia bacterium]
MTSESEPTAATDAPAPSKNAGRFYVLAAAILWSSSGLFAKAPLFDDWPAADRGPLLAFWRATFAAMVLLPAVRRPRWRPGLAPLTLSFTLMNTTYLVGMTLTTAANAIWLQSIAPWWVFLMAVFILHEPIVRRDLIPLVFGLLGVGLILSFEFSRGTGHGTTGVICGLASGFFYSSVVICMRSLRGENPVWLVALCHLVAAACLFPWVLSRGTWPSIPQLVVLAGFGALQMAAPYLFMMRGLQSVSPQEAVGIGLIEPVLLPMWVLLVWGEVPAWWTVAGAALILAGLLLRYFVLSRLAKRSPLP